MMAGVERAEREAAARELCAPFAPVFQAAKRGELDGTLSTLPNGQPAFDTGTIVRSIREWLWFFLVECSRPETDPAVQSWLAYAEHFSRLALANGWITNQQQQALPPKTKHSSPNTWPFPVLWTAGHTGRKIADFASDVEEADALVVDVRRKVDDRQPGWSQRALMNRFHRRYIHVPELCDMKPDGGTVTRIKDMDAGLRYLCTLPKTPVILCSCCHFSQCHRRIIAAACAERGLPHQEFVKPA